MILMLPAILMALQVPPLPEGAQDAFPSPPDPPFADWKIESSFLVRGFFGHTRVREWDSNPALLRMQDLGIAYVSGGHVECVRETRSLRWEIGADVFFASGSGRLNQDFDYDEGHFKGGIPFDSSGFFLFIRPLVIFKSLFGGSEKEWIAPVVGLEYPHLRVGISAEDGEKTTEGYKQFLPYPVGGIAARLPMSETLSLEARIVGSWVPDMPTPFEEGGTIRMSVVSVGAQAGISWTFSRVLSLHLTAEYVLWSGRLHSMEDDNRLTFSSPGFLAGLALRW